MKKKKKHKKAEHTLDQLPDNDSPFLNIFLCDGYVKY